MFHDRIRELRENFGMSQKEVARELNVSTSAIGMYEQGRRTPGLELVVAYADLFSVTTDSLLRGDELIWPVLWAMLPVGNCCLCAMSGFLNF